MAELKTNLLTEQDVEYIRDVGVPIGDHDSLWLRTTDEDILVTLKGRQFLAEVSRVHQMPLPPDVFTLFSALCLFRFQVSRLIDDAEIAEAKELLASGKAGKQDREMLQAFATGTNEEFLIAACRNAEFSRAGPNVIPIGK